jgi:hypothetical protein
VKNEELGRDLRGSNRSAGILPPERSGELLLSGLFARNSPSLHDPILSPNLLASKGYGRRSSVAEQLRCNQHAECSIPPAGSNQTVPPGSEQRSIPGESFAQVVKGPKSGCRSASHQ